jgi:hypothetical protein
MESIHDAVGIVNSKDVSPQTVLSPLDADDYFELACEADEFGVHILCYSIAE